MSLGGLINSGPGLLLYLDVHLSIVCIYLEVATHINCLLISMHELFAHGQHR